MSRRSTRLLAVGYYGEDPNMSYRETAVKVFRRRRNGVGPQDSAHGSRTGSNITRATRALHLDTSYCSEDEMEVQGTSSSTLSESHGSKMLSITLCLLSVIEKIIANSNITNYITFFMLYNISLHLESESESELLLLHLNVQLGRRCGHPVGDEMADFALESQGGRVLRHLCSPSYLPKSSSLWSLTSCFHPRSPRTVIQGQPELLPGQCWAFAGGTGHMVISLSHPINISHVTLDHIASHKTPTGRIDSAPKNIIVYGMADCENTEGTLLGNFVYDEEGEPSQTFTLHGGDVGVFKLVKLLVQTNWGHPDHTCLYRFRVHGKIHSH
ncbi:unnamed protein product [Lota lota]